MTNEQLVYDKDYNTLIKANNRYLMKVAQSMNQDDHYEDLLQAGRVGLFYASQHYKPILGVPFIKYAGWWVRKEMLKYLTKNSRTIRLPQNVQLASAKGDYNVTTNTVSISAQINENQTIEDLLENSPVDEENDLLRVLPYYLEKLPVNLQKVVNMYHYSNDGDGMTFEEIGVANGYTRSNAQNLYKKAIKQLRELMIK